MRVALALLLALTGGSAASAHRRDEYLQATRVALDPSRVQLQLDLTPGIAVADRVLADVDGDRDGAISPAEQQSYAGRVLGAIAMDVDGVRLAPRVTASTFPPLDAMRNGEGTIALEIAAPLPALAAGPHRLHYRNTHRPDIGVYLANALVPASDRVRISAQDRDTDQRTLEITYVVTADAPGLRRPLIAAGTALVVLALFWVRRRGPSRPS